MHRLNCLHWIIIAKRDDIYKYVMESFFKSGVKTGAGSQQQQQSLDQVSISIEPHVLANCLRGEESTKAEFHVVHFSDKKQSEVVGDQPPAQKFTAQFKGWDQLGRGVELGQELQSRRKLNYQLKRQLLSDDIDDR